jgi:hypothetical protein
MLRSAAALALAAWLLCPQARAQSSAGALETKLSVETSLERRVTALLQSVLGTDRVAAVINVRLEAEEARPELLPGVPVKAADVSLRSSLTMVRSLSATVLVDEQAKDEELALARSLASGLLGIDAARGDALEVRRQAFRRELKALTPLDLLVPPHLWQLLWLCVALLTVILLPSIVKTLADAVRVHGEAVRTLQPPAAGEAERVESLAPSAAALPALEAAGARAGAEGQPFGFLREVHLPQLVYLLRKAPPELVAVVVHYLPPALASRVVSSLDEGLRRAVAASLGSVSELTEANVRKIEQFVRSKVDFMVGGEAKLLELLENAAFEVQRAILDDVAGRDPALAERLKARLLRLGDIGALEPVEIQGLVRRVGMPALAQVLRSVPEVADRVAKKLPAGMAERMGQELALARPLPPERLEAERHKVLSTMKAMAAEGWIVIKKEAPQAPAAKAGEA